MVTLVSHKTSPLERGGHHGHTSASASDSMLLPGSAALSRRPVAPSTTFASSDFPSGRGFSFSRLRLHLLLHHLLHFLHGGLSFVSTYHPRISVRIHDLAAAVAPKHVRDRTLARSSEAKSLGDYFVDIFHVDKESRRGCANTFGRACAPRGIFRSQHHRPPAQRQLGAHRFAIGTVHDPALRKAKSFLIKARSSRNIGDCEHSGDTAEMLFVEWINFLLSHGVPLWCSSLEGQHFSEFQRCVHLAFFMPETGSHRRCGRRSPGPALPATGDKPIVAPGGGTSGST